MGSKKSTKQEQTQTDSRRVNDVALSDNAVGVTDANNNTLTQAEVVSSNTVSGSGNVVNIADAGLIKQAFDFLSEADAANSARAEAVLDSSKDILDSAYSASGNILAASESAASGSKTMLMLAALGVGGLVILKGMK